MKHASNLKIQNNAMNLKPQVNNLPQSQGCPTSPVRL